MKVPVIILSASVLTNEDRKFLNHHLMQVIKKHGYDADSFVRQVNEVLFLATLSA